MIRTLFNLFFPKVCYACNKLLHDEEQYVCTSCRHQLPVTNYHFNNDNKVLNIFYGRLKLEQATALLRFEKKSLTQTLLHNLKYKGYEEIGVFLGEWLGEELKESGNYNTVDIVIPVPLHKKRQRKRGYNQVAKFGKQIAIALNASYVDDVLIKVTDVTSQVTKNRFTRWTNNDEIFKVVNAKKIVGKHILLVDDIITTGATIDACATVLQNSAEVKISVATIAIV